MLALLLLELLLLLLLLLSFGGQSWPEYDSTLDSLDERSGRYSYAMPLYTHEVIAKLESPRLEPTAAAA